MGHSLPTPQRGKLCFSFAVDAKARKNEATETRTPRVMCVDLRGRMSAAVRTSSITFKGRQALSEFHNEALPMEDRLDGVGAQCRYRTTGLG